MTRAASGDLLGGGGSMGEVASQKRKRGGEADRPARASPAAAPAPALPERLSDESRCFAAAVKCLTEHLIRGRGSCTSHIEVAFACLRHEEAHMQLLHVGSKARTAHAALNAARGQRREGSPRRSQPISALMSLVGPGAQQALGRAQTCSREVLAALHRAAGEACSEQGQACGSSPNERMQVGGVPIAQNPAFYAACAKQATQHALRELPKRDAIWAQLQKIKRLEIGARKAVRAMLSSLDSAVSDLQELRGLLGHLQRRLQARTSSSGMEQGAEPSDDNDWWEDALQAVLPWLCGSDGRDILENAPGMLDDADDAEVNMLMRVRQSEEEGHLLTWGDLEAAAGYSPKGACHDPYDIQVYCAYFALPRVFEEFGDELVLRRELAEPVAGLPGVTPRELMTLWCRIALLADEVHVTHRQHSTDVELREELTTAPSLPISMEHTDLASGPEMRSAGMGQESSVLEGAGSCERDVASIEMRSAGGASGGGVSCTD